MVRVLIVCFIVGSIIRLIREDSIPSLVGCLIIGFIIAISDTLAVIEGKNKAEETSK